MQRYKILYLEFTEKTSYRLVNFVILKWNNEPGWFSSCTGILDTPQSLKTCQCTWQTKRNFSPQLSKYSSVLKLHSSKESWEIKKKLFSKVSWATKWTIKMKRLKRWISQTKNGIFFERPCKQHVDGILTKCVDLKG